MFLVDWTNPPQGAFGIAGFEGVTLASSAQINNDRVIEIAFSVFNVQGSQIFFGIMYFWMQLCRVYYYSGVGNDADSTGVKSELASQSGLFLWGGRGARSWFFSSCFVSFWFSP